MFSANPEKPAWVLSALAIVGGVVLVATGHVVPVIVQGLALAGLTAAVALVDNKASNAFAWVLVVLAVLGIVVLSLLSDAVPPWLEAVGALGVTGAAALSVPSPPAVPAIGGHVIGSPGPPAANR